MYSFLNHTSLNYVYAEYRRKLLTEDERERHWAQVPAIRFTWASVFSVVNAGHQALLLARTRFVAPKSVALGRREEQDAKQPHRFSRQQMPAGRLLPQTLRRIPQPGDHSRMLDQVRAAVQRREQTSHPGRSD